ncbi:MAG: OmpA family protein [Oligoflexales bacterium]
MAFRMLGFIFCALTSTFMYHDVWANETKENQQLSAQKQKKGYLVTRFHKSSEGSSTLVLGLTPSFKPEVGDVLDVFRQIPHASPVRTGLVKIIEVKKTFALAELLEDGTAEAANFFPRAKGVMIGDWAVEKKVEIIAAKIITPSDSLQYDEIFADPKAEPYSYELTPEGKDRIKELAARFKDVRLPVVMIEAYTDAKGSSEANQIEAYQRALTVRQFLVDDLGFDAERVVAIGYGESELASPGYAPGSDAENRRIVFKAKSESTYFHKASF